MSAIKSHTRRNFVKATIAISPLVTVRHSLAGQSAADANEFKYEVVRSDAEWRGLFDDETYKILRQGDTEWPESSKWWNDYSDGRFSCVGCGLPNYDSVWRARIDKGWVFFKQSIPNAILMGIDGVPPDGMADENTKATIEAHCRRCGSHLGHILKVEGSVVHCINGKALDFRRA